MALKFTVTADEHAALDESLQGLYSETGDGFTLDTEGDHPGVSDATAKLNEFRTNNRTLKGERDDLKAKLAEFEKAKEKNTKAKATLEDRIAAIEAEAKANRERAEAAEARVADNEFSRIVRKTASKAGVTETALGDYTHRLRRLGFRLGDDGKVADEDGRSLDEIVTADKKDAPFFFAGSTGGGSTPGGPRSKGGPAPKKVGSILGNIDDVISGKAEYEGAEA